MLRRIPGMARVAGMPSRFKRPPGAERTPLRWTGFRVSAAQRWGVPLRRPRLGQHGPARQACSWVDPMEWQGHDGGRVHRGPREPERTGPRPALGLRAIQGVVGPQDAWICCSEIARR